MNLTKSLKMQKEAERRIPRMTQLLSERPELRDINKDIIRNEGLAESLREDASV